MSFGEKQEKLDSLLNDAVRQQMISDVPIGVLLSGGLDSSLIAALMRKNTNRTINSFTIKIAQQDLKAQGIVDDSKYALKVAEDFGFNHKEIEIDPQIIDLLPRMVYHLDEILVDPAAINTYLISKAAKDAGISVLLSGIGADELFAGYRIHRAMNAIHKLGGLSNNLVIKKLTRSLSEVPIGKFPLSPKYGRWLKKIFFLISQDPELRHIYAKDSTLIPEEHTSLFVDNYKYEDLPHIKKEMLLFSQTESSYLNKICFSDSKIYLPDHNLMYMDKAMMAASVEGRPPLIDYRIAEFAFSCSETDKIFKGNQKHILKEVSKSYLNPEIIDRPKAPFAAPLRSWIKNDLREFIGDMLSSDRLKRRGLFTPAYVSKILHENSTGRYDHSQLIFRLLITEVWFDTFFNNTKT